MIDKKLFLIMGIIVTGTILAIYATESAGTAKNSESLAIVPSQNVAFAAGEPICSGSNQKVQQAMLNHNLPKELPSGYSAQDGWADDTIMSLWYAPGTICGKDSKYATLESGVLQYYTRSLDPTRDAKLLNAEQYFEDYKTHPKRPEVKSLFQINGYPAVGWEIGWKKDIVEFVNGTIISEKNIQYPAEVQIIDPVHNIYYSFKGYFSLDELKNIARSTV